MRYLYLFLIANLLAFMTTKIGFLAILKYGFSIGGGVMFYMGGFYFVVTAYFYKKLSKSKPCDRYYFHQKGVK